MKILTEGDNEKGFMVWYGIYGETYVFHENRGRMVHMYTFKMAKYTLDK